MSSFDRYMFSGIKQRTDNYQAQAQKDTLVKVAKQSSTFKTNYSWRSKLGLRLTSYGLKLANRPELASLQKLVAELK